MTDKYERNAIAQTNEIKIVPAADGEDPDFWLVSADGDEFPVNLAQLHDIMHAVHELHDKAHTH